jgi:hypothetical protein
MWWRCSRRHISSSSGSGVWSGVEQWLLASGWAWYHLIPACRSWKVVRREGSGEDRGVEFTNLIRFYHLNQFDPHWDLVGAVW